MNEDQALRNSRSIGVIIPTYKAINHILQVIADIGSEVSKIYVVDDCCPDRSGDLVEAKCQDSRVVVIRHIENKGVGGAVKTGYLAALQDDMQILVKIDSDGQMDPSLIPEFTDPIFSGEADYAKGNRFYNLEGVRAMPRLRLWGNAVLSLLCKLSSGYWTIFDPTNGYTAIHADVVRLLPFDKISNRYFFETDMLFRLNTLRAMVIDVPMDARYANEVSNLMISRVVGEFFSKHIRNFAKRIFYNYYLRDMSIASIQLPVGIILFGFGFSYGCYHWTYSSFTQTVTPAGTVMLSALPIILGIQFILAFIGYDINTVPNRPIHRSKGRRSSSKEPRCYAF